MKKQIKRSLAIALDSELDNLIKEPGMKMISRIDVRKTSNSIKKDIEEYHELRNSLLKELGEEHEDNKGSFSVKKESLPEFNKQLQECLDAEIEINVVFSLDSLEGINEDSPNHYGNVIDLFL